MIRDAKETDEESISRLGKLVNSNYEKLFDFKKILNRNYSKILVLEEKNIVKGFIHYDILSDNIDIINIVIDLNERQKGYGSMLLSHLINNINKDIKSITLEVSSNNEAAKNLYLKNGFEIINVRKKYYGEEDGLLMKRWIK